jgi:hypothetical protein
MDPYDLPEEFSHLQAQDMTKLGFMQDLIRGIKKIAQDDTPRTTVVKENAVSGGGANTAPLLKRAFMFLEDGDWRSADEYCEKVLDINPECAEAYLGKLMAELEVKKQDDLKDLDEPFDDNNNYQKFLRFDKSPFADTLKDYNDKISLQYQKEQQELEERLRKEKLEKEERLRRERLEREERLKQQKEQQKQAILNRISEINQSIYEWESSNEQNRIIWLFILSFIVFTVGVGLVVFEYSVGAFMALIGGIGLFVLYKRLESYRQEKEQTLNELAKEKEDLLRRKDNL